MKIQTSTSAPTAAHYSRLCPSIKPQWGPYDEGVLRELAAAMRGPAPDGASRREQTMLSGYVYFGQFVDHDITRDVRRLAEAGPDTDETINYRTPRLDLELLYSNSPEAHPYLYEHGGRLRLDNTESGDGVASTPDDLPRDGEGRAQVVDPRSDENVIIAQMHVLWAKFHNRVLDLLKEQPTLARGPYGAGLFEQARRWVTWHYQWIVWNDLLPHIVPQLVLDDVAQNGLHLFPRLYTPADAPIDLPIEFTLAAYRFGHSMVRDSYFFNGQVRTVDAMKLLELTGRGKGITRHLPAKWVIQWDRFFTGTSNMLNRAQNIDTFISETLYDLPPHAVSTFRLAPADAEMGGPPAEAIVRVNHVLPELTLIRGSRARLPSGQEFAERFGYEPMSPEQVVPRPQDQDFFKKNFLDVRTPLWFYLLREAVVDNCYEPEPEPRHRAIQKLGKLGGRIVAETFLQILQADYNSIRHAGKGWTPPPFTFQGANWTIKTMHDVVRFTA